jgi:hypothetical protein
MFNPNQYRKMELMALKPENQALVTEADKCLTKYFLLNDLKEIAFESDNLKEAEKLDLLEDKALDAFFDVCTKLPIYEVELLERYLYY